MPLILNGTTGVSGIDGSAGTPSYQGGDTNTGIFYPAADTIAFAEGGTEVMRITSAGNVGIGTTTPGNKFTVFGDSIGIQNDNSYLAIYSTAGTRYGYLQGTSGTMTLAHDAGSVALTAGGANTIVFNTNSTERMRIDSSGNVGIGSTSPLSKLEVVGGQFRVANTSTAAVCIISTDSTSTNGVTVESSYYGGAGYGPMKFNTGGSERMRITSSGDVGIGTTSPTNKLHVVGTAKIEGSTLDLNDAGTFTISQNTSNSALVIRAASNSFMRFDTNGSTERMRITSGGNLLVNTTGNLTFAGRLQVDNSGENTTSFRCTTNNFPIVCHNTTTVGTRNLIYFATATSTNVGTITSDGTGTNYNSNSDYRLKENIAPMTGALAKVSQLKPCTYTWKSNGSAGQGFIAHELQAVVPDAVVGEKDAVDKDGNPVYQGIDTSFLVATLTAAIQEQQAMIEELKAKVAALEK